MRFFDALEFQVLRSQPHGRLPIGRTMKGGKRLAIVAIAVASGFAIGSFATTGASTPAPSVSALTVANGDTYTKIAQRLAPNASTAKVTALAHALARRNGGTDQTSIVTALTKDLILFYLPSDIPGADPTTTTQATTTTAPTSTAPTSTAPPTTMATTTTSMATTTTSTMPATTTTTPSTGSAPGCGLAAAAFCATFDSPKNGGTQTGDLDPTLWGVSRIGDIAQTNGVNISHNLCAGGAATPPPADVRICNGQLVESNNDGGLITALDMYPKQPFDFTGRTGKVVFDVGNNSSGSHGAWPDFLITDEPVPGAVECISECNLGEDGTEVAQNEIGFDMSATNEDMDTWGITRFWVVKNGVMQGNAIDSTTYGSVTKGSPTKMNHVEVNVSTTRIDVYATDAGSKTLVHIAGADIPGGLAFSKGLVWMNDVHYNATKAVEPCGCGTLIDHSFAWDNLGFDGPKTYRDLGFDVPLPNTPTSYRNPNGGTEIQEGYDTNGNRSFTVSGVNWQQTPTSAKVVLDAYAHSETNVTVTLNGHTEHAITKPIASFHGQARSFQFPASDAVTGNNTIKITSPAGDLIVANVSLIMVAGAPVP